MFSHILSDALAPRRKTTLIPRIHLPAKFKAQQAVPVDRNWVRLPGSTSRH